MREEAAHETGTSLDAGTGDGGAQREAWRRSLFGMLRPLGLLIEAEASRPLEAQVRIDFASYAPLTFRAAPARSARWFRPVCRTLTLATMPAYRASEAGRPVERVWRYSVVR